MLESAWTQSVRGVGGGAAPARPGHTTEQKGTPQPKLVDLDLGLWGRLARLGGNRHAHRSRSHRHPGNIDRRCQANIVVFGSGSRGWVSGHESRPGFLIRAIGNCARRKKPRSEKRGREAFDAGIDNAARTLSIGTEKFPFLVIEKFPLRAWGRSPRLGAGVLDSVELWVTGPPQRPATDRRRATSKFSSRGSAIAGSGARTWSGSISRNSTASTSGFRGSGG